MKKIYNYKKHLKYNKYKLIYKIKLKSIKYRYSLYIKCLRPVKYKNRKIVLTTMYSFTFNNTCKHFVVVVMYIHFNTTIILTNYNYI